MNFEHIDSDTSDTDSPSGNTAVEKTTLQDAVTSYFQRFRGKLLAIAGSILSDSVRAEDVVNQSYLAIFQKLPDLEMLHETGLFKIRSYIIKAVKNRALNMIRDANKRCELEDIHTDCMPSVRRLGSPEDIAMDAERANVIRSYLNSLSVHHKEILILFYVDGLNTYEIAENLNIKPGTVSSRINRAKAALKAKLAAANLHSTEDI